MKSFIFDIDGTLLDTEAMYMRALQEVLDQQGDHRPYAELATTFGIPSYDALVKLGVKNIDQIQPLWDEATRKYFDTVAVYPGVRTALQQLKDQGAQLAIMTSKVRAEYERDVVKRGLADYFSQVVVADDVAQGKPAPDGILLAMHRLAATPQETIYVGDTIYDLQAAHAGKMTFGLAAWNGRHPDLQPDVTFNTPADMLTLL